MKKHLTLHLQNLMTTISIFLLLSFLASCTGTPEKKEVPEAVPPADSVAMRATVTDEEMEKFRKDHEKHLAASLEMTPAAAGVKKFSDCYNCVPAECVANGCINPVCQGTIRDCHSIATLHEFEIMIKLFTGGNIYAPKKVPASVIEGLINPVEDCDNPQIIQLCADHNILNSNAEIIIGLYPITNPLCDAAEKNIKIIGKARAIQMAKYSRALFAGVMQIQPDTFYFYKAIGIRKNPNLACLESHKRDIIFKAVKFNAAGEEELVYYGDVSDLLP